MIDRVRSIAICKNSNKKKGLMSSVRLNQPLILPYNTPFDGYCTGHHPSDRVTPANGSLQGRFCTLFAPYAIL
jgi:hypothetical protein